MHKILMIQGDPAFRILFKEILEQDGWSVVEAESCMDGLFAYANIPDISVIFLTTECGPEDGDDPMFLIREARRHDPHVGIVVLDARGEKYSLEDFGLYTHHLLIAIFNRTVLKNAVTQAFCEREFNRLAGKKE